MRRKLSEEANERKPYEGTTDVEDIP